MDVSEQGSSTLQQVGDRRESVWKFVEFHEQQTSCVDEGVHTPGVSASLPNGFSSMGSATNAIPSAKALIAFNSWMMPEVSDGPSSSASSYKNTQIGRSCGHLAKASCSSLTVT